MARMLAALALLGCASARPLSEDRLATALRVRVLPQVAIDDRALEPLALELAEEGFTISDAPDAAVRLAIVRAPPAGGSPPLLLVTALVERGGQRLEELQIQRAGEDVPETEATARQMLKPLAGKLAVSPKLRGLAQQLGKVGRDPSLTTSPGRVRRARR